MSNERELAIEELRTVIRELDKAMEALYEAVHAQATNGPVKASALRHIETIAKACQLLSIDLRSLPLREPPKPKPIQHRGWKRAGLTN